MILYTDKNEKVKCIKTTAPKIRGKNIYFWDNFERKIDNIDTKFCFTVKNNRSYFYFVFLNEWYKTPIVTEQGLDLWYYLYDIRENLKTKKG